EGTAVSRAVLLIDSRAWRSPEGRGAGPSPTRNAMKRTHPYLLLAACLAACNGSSLTDATPTTTDSSLTSAQCTFQGFNSAVQACFDTFKTCLANSEEATAADCQAALKACLPAPPQRPQADGSGGPQGGPRGDCGGPGGMGPMLDGGEAPRPPQGGGGHGGPGMGPPPMLADGGLP